MDEKTRVIPAPATPQNSASFNKPVPAPAPQPAPPKTPSLPAAPAAGNVLQRGEPGTMQKKRIITGIIAGGTLLGIGLLATSFMPKTGNAATADDMHSDGLTGTKDGATHADTTGTDDLHPARKVSVTTDHPVSEMLLDDLTLKDAREVAREELGARGIFSHQGQLHATVTEEEVKEMTPQERADYLAGIVTHDITNEKIDMDGHELEVKVAGMSDFGKVINHQDGSSYWYDKQGQATVLENVSENGYHQLVRTDPETGEVTPFNPALILKNVAQGVIDVAMYPSNVDIINSDEVVLPGSDTPADPIDTGTYLIGLDNNGNIIAGWDTDGDRSIDVPDQTFAIATAEPLMVAYDADEHQDTNTGTGSFSITSTSVNEKDAEPQTQRELAMDKLHQLATEAGIEVDKIKLHETDDGGFDYKVKGDGGKLKGHFSPDDLKAPGDAPHEHQTGYEDTGGMQAGSVTEPSENSTAPTHDAAPHTVQDTPAALDVPAYYTANDYEADQPVNIPPDGLHEIYDHTYQQLGGYNPEELPSSYRSSPDEYTG